MKIFYLMIIVIIMNIYLIKTYNKIYGKRKNRGIQNYITVFFVFVCVLGCKNSSRITVNNVDIVLNSVCLSYMEGDTINDAPWSIDYCFTITNHADSMLNIQVSPVPPPPKEVSGWYISDYSDYDVYAVYKQDTMNISGDLKLLQKNEVYKGCLDLDVLPVGYVNSKYYNNEFAVKDIVSDLVENTCIFFRIAGETKFLRFNNKVQLLNKEIQPW